MTVSKFTRGSGRLAGAALGAMVAGHAGPAQADQPSAQPQPAAVAVLAQAGGVEHGFTIPAQPLADALAAFARQSGMQVSVDAQMIRDIASPGVTGSLTPEAALGALLAGTGIGYRLDGSNSAILERRAAQSSQGPVTLDPVRIYGAKTTTTLEDSDSSVAVVDSDMIEDGQIRSFRDTFRQMGNVMDNAWADAGFSIRGMSSEGFVPGGAPVGSLYIDGVLQSMYAARRGARGTWDVEQVEVYRGPQSTVSGRAAMAGAIYIKTKDPVFEQEAALSTTAGTDHLLGTSFMVNQPFAGDQVALRMTGEMQRKTNDLNYPNYERYDRYSEFDTDSYYNLRGKVLIQPKALEDTQALLSYSVARDAPALRDIGTSAGVALTDNRGDFNQAVYSEQRRNLVHNAGLDITHDLSSDLVFTSQSGLNYSFTSRPSINESSAGEVNVANGEWKNILVSQELRLNYDGEAVDWVAGAFGSIEKLDTYYTRVLSATRRDMNFVHRDTYNLAAFGEATWEFVPSWKGTLGGRIDHVSQDSTQSAFRNQPLNAATTLINDYGKEINELNFVPKIGLAKDLAEGHVVGVTYSEGFRTGGTGLNTSTNTVYSYDPEKAKSYEAYYKGQFLGGRVALNSNLFYTEYQDLQVEMRLNPADSLSREVTNAASARSYGFEIEPSAQLTEALSAFLSVGYLHTEFKEFNHATYGDLSGKAFPEAPELTLALGGQYKFDSGLRVGGDAKYTSHHYSSLGTPPLDSVGSRTVVNAQIGYDIKDWEFTLFAENLFDRRYFTYYESTGGQEYATLGEGRTIGINVKARF